MSFGKETFSIEEIIISPEKVLRLLEIALNNGLRIERVLGLVDAKAEVELRHQLKVRGYEDFEISDFSLNREFMAEVSFPDGTNCYSDCIHSGIEGLADDLLVDLKAQQKAAKEEVR